MKYVITLDFESTSDTTAQSYYDYIIAMAEAPNHDGTLLSSDIDTLPEDPK